MVADSVLRRSVEAIHEDVHRHAVALPGGGLGWFDVGGPDVPTLRANVTLYNGQPGVALFSAAACELLDVDRDRADLETALEPLFGASEQALELETIGVTHGFGGLVYALVRVGDFLSWARPLEQAGRIASFVSPDRIENDEQYTVSHGSAGGILGLLALYEQRPTERFALDRAIRCGDHLLNNRTTTSNGHRVWETTESRPTVGFLRGTAGITYALSRLARASGHDRFRRAAREGFAYLDDRLSDSTGPPRPTDANGSTRETGWCDGVTGVGLAYLGGLSMGTTDWYRGKVAEIATAVGRDLEASDCICHGTFGRIAFLARAGVETGDQRLVDEAHRLARRTIDRKRDRGFFVLANNQYERLYRPSLFRGTAGIGYTLLSLLEPGDVPSILLLE